MAEPLRYVPDGYTPSSDPAADSHIWYPYELVTVDGTLTAKALQDEALSSSTVISTTFMPHLAAKQLLRKLLRL